MIASVNIHSPPQNNGMFLFLVLPILTKKVSTKLKLFIVLYSFTDIFILTLLTLIASAFSIIASILLIVGVSGVRVRLSNLSSLSISFCRKTKSCCFLGSLPLAHLPFSKLLILFIISLTM